MCCAPRQRRDFRTWGGHSTPARLSGRTCTRAWALLTALQCSFPEPAPSATSATGTKYGRAATGTDWPRDTDDSQPPRDWCVQPATAPVPVLGGELMQKARADGAREPVEQRAFAGSYIFAGRPGARARSMFFDFGDRSRTALMPGRPSRRLVCLDQLAVVLLIGGRWRLFCLLLPAGAGCCCNVCHRVSPYTWFACTNSAVAAYGGPTWPSVGASSQKRSWVGTAVPSGIFDTGSYTPGERSPKL